MALSLESDRDHLAWLREQLTRAQAKRLTNRTRQLQAEIAKYEGRVAVPAAGTPPAGTTWEVHEGRPSWHQQKAGHISAGVTTGFTSRADAVAFVDRCKAYRPDAWIFVCEVKGI